MRAESLSIGRKQQVRRGIRAEPVLCQRIGSKFCKAPPTNLDYESSYWMRLLPLTKKGGACDVDQVLIMIVVEFSSAHCLFLHKFTAISGPAAPQRPPVILFTFYVSSTAKMSDAPPPFT